MQPERQRSGVQLPSEAFSFKPKFLNTLILNNQKWGLMHKKNLIVCLILLALVLGCSKAPTGKATAAEPNIYEAPGLEQEDALNAEDNQSGIEQKIQIKTGEEYYDELVNDKPAKENIDTEEFKFSQESVVSTQNNISLSIDNIKHEIKSAYWGKIVEITATALNKGHEAFKPKLLVLLYDEKDFKEEWLKPKAEILLEGQLSPGEHITTQAIVNIAFDDINLMKNFKLVLVDSADPGNKPLVVVEKEFNSVLG